MADQQDSKQAIGQTAARNAAQAGGEAVRQGAEAGGEALRRSSEVNAEATRRVGQAAADVMHRAGNVASDTTNRTAQNLAESQQRLGQDTTERFEEVTRKVSRSVQDVTQNVRTLMTLPNAARDSLQELQQSVTGLIEGIAQTNLRLAQELVHLANPSPLVELQQRFLREYLDTALHGSANIVRAVRHAADQTLQPIEQQIEQRRRSEQRFRHAAE